MTGAKSAGERKRPVEILSAGPGDADILSSLGRCTFQETYGADLRPAALADHVASTYGVQEIRNEIARQGTRYFLARMAGKSAGYAKLRTGTPPDCVGDPRAVELHQIYVLKDCQGCGAGDALIRRCVGASTHCGRRTLWLGVWKQNHSAQRFYQRQGFQRVGEQSFFIGPDRQTDWVMVRRLATR